MGSSSANESPQAPAGQPRTLITPAGTGTPRGAHDLIIAAHALQTDRIVLTLDAKARFGDLPGLSITSG
jgi:tRNA(fMet)-specific endonuclease VapC